MKKIVFALTAIAVLLTACSKDFINPKHNSSEPLDEYFNTPERLFQCLVAAYDPLNGMTMPLASMTTSTSSSM